jgi:hypothetical protein
MTSHNDSGYDAAHVALGNTTITTGNGAVSLEPGMEIAAEIKIGRAVSSITYSRQSYKFRLVEPGPQGHAITVLEMSGQLPYIRDLKEKTS